MLNTAKIIFIFCTLILSSLAFSSAQYPDHWWQPIDESTAASWEILPQAAGPGEVILSKRNELGILSNFTTTPFTFEGVKYQSMEGFWQMMKYPENSLDLRATSIQTWPVSREELSQMSGFQAKKFGDVGSKNMKKLAINWVTYKGEKLPYKVNSKGRHYEIIRAAMKAKLDQNSNVKKILLATGSLILRPDHHQKGVPPAWRYATIWMDLRREINTSMKQ